MQKPPLYRSVNTRTHGVKHGLGGDYRNERNKKAVKASDVNRSSMRSHHRHGRDYTPLFRFLLSKVGGNWNGHEKGTDLFVGVRSAWGINLSLLLCGQANESGPFAGESFRPRGLQGYE